MPLNEPRWQATLAAAVMAVLFGVIVALPKAEAATDKRARNYVWVGYVVGVLFSTAAAFVFFGPGEYWLKKIGFSDGFAIGGFIGTLALPLAPFVIKRFTRVLVPGGDQ